VVWPCGVVQGGEGGLPGERRAISKKGESSVRGGYKKSISKIKKVNAIVQPTRGRKEVAKSSR